MEIKIQECLGKFLKIVLGNNDAINRHYLASNFRMIGAVGRVSDASRVWAIAFPCKHFLIHLVAMPHVTGPQRNRGILCVSWRSFGSIAGCTLGMAAPSDEAGDVARPAFAHSEYLLGGQVLSPRESLVAAAVVYEEHTDMWRDGAISWQLLEQKWEALVAARHALLRSGFLTIAAPRGPNRRVPMVGSVGSV